MEQLTFDEYCAELEVAAGLCECGCGQITSIAKSNNARFGYVKGQHVRFMRGHRRHRRPPWGSPEARPEFSFDSLLAEPLLRPENRAWVYALWNADREALYVGKVIRFHYLGRLDEHSHKSSWWAEVAFYSVEEVAVPDVLEAEFQAIRKLRPKYNTANTAKCGTLSGYKLHAARNEPPCDPCREAGSAHRRDRRREKGISPPQKAQCGTYGGYCAHMRRREPACDPCREAHTEYAKTRRREMGAVPNEESSVKAKERWAAIRLAAQDQAQAS